VTVGGSVLAGTIRAEEDLGPVKIRGDLFGTQDDLTGIVVTNGRLAGVTVGGSVRGGAGRFSGMISASKEAGAIIIGGDVVGGAATGQNNLWNSGLVTAQRIASLTLGGSLIAGTDNTSGVFLNNGAIRAGDGGLGSMVIRGNVIGNLTNPAIVSAMGVIGRTEPAIGFVRVRGRVELGQILAGYDRNGYEVHADASIGTVVIHGDFVASSISAGVGPGPNQKFGDLDDSKLGGLGFDVPEVPSRIDRVTIGGRVRGTDTSGDHLGIVAETIGVVTVGGRRLALNSGVGNDEIVVGDTGDFRINEI
jgi:hypothetical protein